MKPITVILLLLLSIVLILSFPISTVRSSSTAFVIVGADATQYYSFSSSAGLNNLIGSVPDRFVAQMADNMRYTPLTKYPDQFQTLLDALGTRIVFQMAESNRFHVLAYPRDLIGDITPPGIGPAMVRGIGGDKVTVSWTSDEFTTSEIRYGANPGVYTQTQGDDTFRLQHQITISGVTSGKMYYFVIFSTDRSGNTSLTSESTFSATYLFYLPSLMKK